MAKLKFWTPLILLGLILIVKFGRQGALESEMTALDFKGSVESIEANRVRTRDSDPKAYCVYVRTTDGKMVEWYVSGMEHEYYQYNDYLIKKAGQRMPASFRENHQQKNAPCFIRETVQRE